VPTDFDPGAFELSDALDGLGTDGPCPNSDVFSLALRTAEHEVGCTDDRLVRMELVLQGCEGVVVESSPVNLSGFPDRSTAPGSPPPAQRTAVTARSCGRAART